MVATGNKTSQNMKEVNKLSMIIAHLGLIPVGKSKKIVKY